MSVYAGPIKQAATYWRVRFYGRGGGEDAEAREEEEGDPPEPGFRASLNRYYVAVQVEHAQKDIHHTESTDYPKTVEEAQHQLRNKSADNLIEAAVSAAEGYIHNRSKVLIYCTSKAECDKIAGQLKCGLAERKYGPLSFGGGNNLRNGNKSAHIFSLEKARSAINDEEGILILQLLEINNTPNTEIGRAAAMARSELCNCTNNGRTGSNGSNTKSSRDD
ncbi:hypothetical protein K440DRAFT_639204 [Wilcoxina mikolae CBS 423.85]|nr:hypothetical protein K440DRAFT_639204 [Wilcoxina mikolae CBS 423.85]